jgi:hypothetical protein
METERESLELEAARVRLQRERLALAREQRAAERPEKVAEVARDLARGGFAAAEVAKGPVLLVARYLLRVLGWLFLWVFIVALFAVFASNWPAYQSYEFQGRLGHLLGVSAPVGLLLPFLYAFVPAREPSMQGALVIAAALIAFGYHSTVGFPAPHTPLPLGPLTPPAAQSKVAGTGRNFSGDCRRMDQSPATQAAYNEQIRMIEREYPQLNPDTSGFRQDLEALVVQQMEVNQRAGYSKCVAARLAADAVMAAR